VGTFEHRRHAHAEVAPLPAQDPALTPPAAPPSARGGVRRRRRSSFCSPRRAEGLEGLEGPREASARRARGGDAVQAELVPVADLHYAAKVRFHRAPDPRTLTWAPTKRLSRSPCERESRVMWGRMASHRQNQVGPLRGGKRRGAPLRGRGLLTRWCWHDLTSQTDPSTDTRRRAADERR